MSEFLLYEQDGAVVTLTMNQPEIRNVLTGNTAPAEFADACARITALLPIAKQSAGRRHARRAGHGKH